MASTKALILRGVRVHNLRNIDVEIPLGRLTVVTGVSGAGKSSLVFDTLYAEAQRRYLQSFSVYTRQFLERFDKPDAETIGPLPPAIAIRGGAPRGTLGAFTEIDAPLRTLFARAGVLLCPGCGQTVRAHRADDVLAALGALPTGTRCTIAFPIVLTEPAEQLAALAEEGYVRIQIRGVVHRLDEPTIPRLKPDDKAWVLLDRVEIGKTACDRLAESVEAAFRRGGGRLGILTDAGETAFDQRYFCPRCQRVFPTPEPRLFDVNDPLGACPTCHGTGTTGKSAETCATCNGVRWNADALAVRWADLTIADAHALPLRALWDRLQNYADIAALQELVGLGLGYLTLRQPAAHLSDGAVRRVALAAALASSLVHVLYLIDQPTVGLHPRELGKLIDALHRLRDRGNTVVVVDNERGIIAAADHVIDLGPGAGADGGSVTYQGPPAGLADAAECPTSDFWTGRASIDAPTQRRKPTGYLELTHIAAKPLRFDSIQFPLGVLCAVSGVGGAGKRTLIERTLYPALALSKKKKGAAATAASVKGAHQIADVVLLDQTPLGRSARSNPATYLKIFDDIRDLFAQTVDAKIRNFGPGHFSFNQPGGRCETCEGQGSLTIDMQFLADVRTVCPDCQGRRYRREILGIKVRSLSIAEVLDLTIREAFRFFRAQAGIEKKLKVLVDVDLDHLRLGQALETLAGSECQRLKLAGHLASSRKAGCLFLLIEPSAGLHPADVANLLACFDRLLSAGHSLIVIDNDADVIRCADEVIELAGPEG